MKIVSFYTLDTPYEKEAEEFKRSLDSYSLDYVIYPVENLGSWELNCAQKSRVISQALSTYKDNLLYLDIDARILRVPTFAEIELELPGFCIWSRTWLTAADRELLSGTIYFPNNDISKALVTDWITEQEKAPKMWDQKTLQKVVDAGKYHYNTLDLKWVFIEKFMKPFVLDPIILHTQVSRILKNKV